MIVADHIALKQRLYCSTYNKLNDPFEGLFKTRILNTTSEGVVDAHKHVGDFPFKLPNICSLSSSLDNVLLWSHYADGHKGVVFEIDFTGIESQARMVKYSESLPSFQSASILIQAFLPDKVLLCKTKHWEYEAEYRILNEGEFFYISDRLTAIYFGSRIDENQYDLLMRTLPDEIPKFKTKINMSKVIVEPQKGSQEK